MFFGAVERDTRAVRGSNVLSRTARLWRGRGEGALSIISVGLVTLFEPRVGRRVTVLGISSQIAPRASRR